MKTHLDGNEKLPNHLDLERRVKYVYPWSWWQCFSVCIDTHFLSPRSSLRVSDAGAERSTASTVPRSAKQRRKSIEKILLQAHTFLSCIERVSFNLALISIFCFWDSLAAHWTRRNKLLPGLSYKKNFQKRPLFCLYVSVSIPGLQGIKIQGIETTNTTGLGHTGARLMQTVRQLHFIYSSQGGFTTKQSKRWTMLARGHNKKILSVAVRSGSVLFRRNRLTWRTAGVVLTALPHHSSPPTSLELTHQRDGDIIASPQVC